MGILYSNNAVSTLAAGISAGSLSLTVQAADGALFPSPTGADYYLSTLQNAAGDIEIIKVTGRTVDTFTIERAQEGTTALAWLSGDIIELRLTAASLSNFRQYDGDDVINTAITMVLDTTHAFDTIQVTGAGGISVDLGDAATMKAGYSVNVKNNSTGLLTIGRDTVGDDIDGDHNDIVLIAGEGAMFTVNSSEDGYITNYSNPLRTIYPIGAIWLNVSSSTNPANILGFGTWARINGRFLVGVGTASGKTYTSGETGGDADAVLVEHDHNKGTYEITGDVRGVSGQRGVWDNATGAFSLRNDASGYADAGGSGSQENGFEFRASDNWSGRSGTEGEDGTFKNLPPYKAVYIWERTA